MSIKTLDGRLAALEIRAADRRAGDPVGDWLAAYRRGDDVHLRNRAAGPAWCDAAAERERLALETLEDYDPAFNYIPSGAS